MISLGRGGLGGIGFGWVVFILGSCLVLGSGVSTTSIVLFTLQHSNGFRNFEHPGYGYLLTDVQFASTQIDVNISKFLVVFCFLLL